MAWIKMIQEDEAEGELKEMYDQNVEPWGGVDNILKIHSLSPESLKAHISLYKTVVYGLPVSRIAHRIFAKEDGIMNSKDHGPNRIRRFSEQLRLRLQRNIDGVNSTYGEIRPWDAPHRTQR